MPLLELKNIRKGYRSPDGAFRAVIALERLVLERGELVALEGGSGTGKSTLLNLIAGIVMPDAGSIVIAGTDIAALREADRDRFRAAHIGYVFQTFNLLQGLTALENVLLSMSFGKGVDEAYAKTLFDRVGLRGREDCLPAVLSVGQQQRVAVVRAMANKPELLLADEPTGSLDRKLAAETMELIRTLCRENGTALFLASHDGKILETFDRVERLCVSDAGLEACA